MLKKIIGFTIVILAFTSCFQSKDIVYLNNINIAKGDTFFINNYNNYKLQFADILYIRIRSLDEDVNKLFNKEQSGGSTTMMTGGSSYIMGYSVNDSGYITLPVIGKIFVLGSSVEQVKEDIKNASVKFITSAEIEVKLLSFKISILGEINAPGVYNIYNNRANIFEAIAQAGDINSYGKRSNLLILRPSPLGTKIIQVDLTNKNLLSSNSYYLQPNDILYVQSLKSTLFRKRLTEYSGIIGIISTLVTSTAIIIALFAKK